MWVVGGEVGVGYTCASLSMSSRGCDRRADGEWLSWKVSPFSFLYFLLPAHPSAR